MRKYAGSWDAGPIVVDKGHITGTSYSIPSGTLEAGQKYRWNVRAWDSSGTASAYSSRLYFQTPAPTVTVPGAPSGLSATTISTSQINLDWDAPSNNGGATVTNYKIYRGTSSGSLSLIYTTQTAGTTFQNTAGLSPGTTYYYKVSAVNSAGEGSKSTIASATTSSAAPSVTVPGAPSGLSATTISSNQINLDWNAPSSNGGATVTNYKIYRGASSGSVSLIYTTQTAGTTFQNTAGLSPGTTYYYKVSAVNSAGEGAQSGSTSATTTTTSSAPTSAPSPHSPGSTGAPGPTTTTVGPTFSWSSVTGATSYNLYISQAPYGAANQVRAINGISGTSHTLTGPQSLPDNTDYRWTVSGSGNGGEGPYSTGYLYFRVQTTSTPSAPTSAPPLSSPGFSSAPGETVATTMPTFSWGSVSGAATYNLYVSRAPYGSANQVLAKTSISGTSYTPSAGEALGDDTDFRWTASASNSGGEGPVNTAYHYFRIRSMTPTTAPGSAPSLSSPGSTSAPGEVLSTTAPTFSWSTVSGASAYNLYVSQAPYGSANQVLAITGLSGTMYTLPSGQALPDNTDYRWTVAGSNGGGAGPVSTEYRYFRIQTAPPPGGGLGIPSNPSPGSSSESSPASISATQQFTWGPASGSADHYQVNLRNMATGVVTTYNTGNRLYWDAPSGTFTAGTTYRWGVWAVDSFGNHGSQTPAIYVLVPDAATPRMPPSNDLWGAVQAITTDADVRVAMMMAAALETGRVTGPFPDQYSGGPGRGPFQIEAGPGGNPPCAISEEDARDAPKAVNCMLGRFQTAVAAVRDYTSYANFFAALPQCGVSASAPPPAISGDPALAYATIACLAERPASMYAPRDRMDSAWTLAGPFVAATAPPPQPIKQVQAAVIESVKPGARLVGIGESMHVTVRVGNVGTGPDSFDVVVEFIPPPAGGTFPFPRSVRHATPVVAPGEFVYLDFDYIATPQSSPGWWDTRTSVLVLGGTATLDSSYLMMAFQTEGAPGPSGRVAVSAHKAIRGLQQSVADNNNARNDFIVDRATSWAWNKATGSFIPSGDLPDEAIQQMNKVLGSELGDGWAAQVPEDYGQGGIVGAHFQAVSASAQSMDLAKFESCDGPFVADMMAYHDDLVVRAVRFEKAMEEAIAIAEAIDGTLQVVLLVTGVVVFIVSGPAGGIAYFAALAVFNTVKDISEVVLVTALSITQGIVAINHATRVANGLKAASAIRDCSDIPNLRVSNSYGGHRLLYNGLDSEFVTLFNPSAVPVKVEVHFQMALAWKAGGTFPDVPDILYSSTDGAIGWPRQSGNDPSLMQQLPYTDLWTTTIGPHEAQTFRTNPGEDFLKLVAQGVAEIHAERGIVKIIYGHGDLKGQRTLRVFETPTSDTSDSSDPVSIFQLQQPEGGIRANFPLPFASSSGIGTIIDISAPNAARASSREATVSQVNSAVRVGRIAVNHREMTMTVDAELETGSVFLINYDGATAMENPVVYVDGVRLSAATDHEDIMNPGDDNGQAEYALSADGRQVLVSIPHYSEHTITITSVEDFGRAFVTPYGLLGLAIAGVVIALVAYGLGRRRGWKEQEASTATDAREARSLFSGDTGRLTTESRTAEDEPRERSPTVVSDWSRPSQQSDETFASEPSKPGP